MKPVKLPLFFKQKVGEVFVQALWLPISAAFSFLTLSPVSLLVWLFYQGARPQILQIWPYFILVCWLPFVLVRFVIMPKLKGFHAAPDIQYNVGESDKIKEIKVNRAVTDSLGRTVGYVEDTKYEVEHDDGNRTELSGDSWALIAYCIFAFPLRCISLFLSVLAVFIPSLFICMRKSSTSDSDFWHMALDILHVGNVFLYGDYQYPFAYVNKLVKVGCGKNICINAGSYKTLKFSSNIIFPERVFENNTALITFTAPRYTITIKENAFANCSSLHTVYIPPYTISFTIEGLAFSNCSSLRSFRFDQNNLYCSVIILPRAFDGCSSLKEIFLPPVKRGDGNEYAWLVYSPSTAPRGAFSPENGIVVPPEFFSDARLIAKLLTGEYKDYIWKRKRVSDDYMKKAPRLSISSMSE